MHIHEPEIAARWDREYGGKIASSNVKRAVSGRTRRKKRR